MKLGGSLRTEAVRVPLRARDKSAAIEEMLSLKSLVAAVEQIGDPAAAGGKRVADLF